MFHHSPALKKKRGGGRVVYYICVVRHSVFHNSVSAKYLQKKNDRMSLNLLYALILTRSRLGLFHIGFRTFVIELWPLIEGQIFVQKFVSVQFLQNKMIEFYQMLYMHYCY